MVDGAVDQLPGILEIIGAVGALGTAAFGLVDASKALPIGIQIVGFSYIEEALTPFGEALNAALGKGADWRGTMRAHWVGGRSKADQKAIAKSLLRLGMTDDHFANFALGGALNVAALKPAIAALRSGEPPSEAQMNLLGRLDAVLDVRIDAAFERAEQRYIAVARAMAAMVALVLALIGAMVIAASRGNFDFWRFFVSRDFVVALLVGAVAVPIAPISKDLISSLSAAVRAVKAASRS